MLGDGCRIVALAGALASPVGDPAALDALLAIEGDPEWGAYLGSECTACHAEGGGQIPQIAGMARDDMLSALRDYKLGARENMTMQQVAAGLSAEEMAALAAYFESVE